MKPQENRSENVISHRSGKNGVRHTTSWEPIGSEVMGTDRIDMDSKILEGLGWPSNWGSFSGGNSSNIM